MKGPCESCGCPGHETVRSKGGRPRKNLNTSELATVIRMREAGASLREIRDRINMERGVWDIPDLAARKRRGVSHALIGDVLKEAGVK